MHVDREVVGWWWVGGLGAWREQEQAESISVVGVGRLAVPWVYRDHGREWFISVPRLHPLTLSVSASLLCVLLVVMRVVGGSGGVI